MATFILVHGAFHGGWCWERLVPLLEARGHRAIAPDLAGMGEDKTPLAEVTNERWGRDLEKLIRAQAEKPILVGHSRAGSTISRAAEYAADHLTGLVYLTAMLVPDGDTMGGVNARLQTSPLPSFGPKPTADGLAMTCDPKMMSALLYNRTDAEGVARAEAMVGVEPIAPVMDVCHFGEAAAALPRAYIECTDDAIIPIDLQRAMHREMPCDPVITLDADHSPFFSCPDDLATALSIVARKWGA